VSGETPHYNTAPAMWRFETGVLVSGNKFGVQITARRTRFEIRSISPATERQMD
jgi:hypothetical protein